MAILEQLNSYSFQLGGQCIDQRRLLKPSKVFHQTLRHVHNRKKSVSWSSTSKFETFTTEIEFKENPAQRSGLGSGFLRNRSSGHVSLNSKLIKDYVHDELYEDAIIVYLKMLEDGFPFEEFCFFPCLIKAFGGLSDVDRIREIHGQVLKLGFLDDIYVANSLLGVYWKCGTAEYAIQLFDNMLERDSVSWSTMISGFCQSGDYINSLLTFSQMLREHGLYPNRVACISALSSCSSIESLIHGQEIHAFLVKNRLDTDEFLVSALIGMYMKCGHIKTAAHVFNSFLTRESSRGNTVIWNVMISGYISNWCFFQAFDLFLKMLDVGILPDSSTLVAVLVLCSELLDLDIAKQVHGFILRLGLMNHVKVKTSVIDMYFKCGNSDDSLKIFRRSQNRNFVMWSTVISNFAYKICPIEALDLFTHYITENGFVDQVILLAVLRACSSLTLKSKGMEIHGLAVKKGFDFDFYLGGALVDMYAKCKDMGSASKVFSRQSIRDLVSWNALICGYAQNECTNEALNAFRTMQSEKVIPNNVTISCVLSVCANLSVLILGKEAHGYLIRRGFAYDILVNNSLIATYAKCGDISSSWTIFNRMPDTNEVSWNSILFGFGMHGCAEEMFSLLEKMETIGMKPDHATFTALLSACSHTGRVNNGWECFKSMVEKYKIDPQLEHYTCMVDLLGRAGHLKEAYDLILSMPCEPDGQIWGSLLGSCKSYGDSKLAKIVANHIFNLDPTNIGYRVLLANIYRDCGKQYEVRRIRSEIKYKGLVKSPGCSWVEVGNNIHVFVSGDNSHFQSKEIYAAIESLTAEIKRAGYTPQLQSPTDEFEESSDY